MVRLRRFDEALAYLEKVQSPQAWDGRAAALAGQGKVEEALAACDQALKFDPRNVSAHCRRGDILRALSRVPEALAAYEAALVLDRQCAPALLAKGELLVARGDSAEALRILKEVLRAAKESGSAWHNFDLWVDRKASLYPGHKPDPCRGASLRKSGAPGVGRWSCARSAALSARPRTRSLERHRLA